MHIYDPRYDPSERGSSLLDVQPPRATRKHTVRGRAAHVCVHCNIRMPHRPKPSGRPPSYDVIRACASSPAARCCSLFLLLLLLLYDGRLRITHLLLIKLLIGRLGGLWERTQKVAESHHLAHLQLELFLRPE